MPRQRYMTSGIPKICSILGSLPFPNCPVERVSADADSALYFSYAHLLTTV